MYNLLQLTIYLKVTIPGTLCMIERYYYCYDCHPKAANYLSSKYIVYLLNLNTGFPRYSRWLHSRKNLKPRITKPAFQAQIRLKMTVSPRYSRFLPPRSSKPRILKPRITRAACIILPAR
jgi:hypothetical protein